MATNEGGWWERERLSFITERLTDVTPAGGSILDVGCGTGLILGAGELPAGITRVSVDSYLWPEWKGRDHSLYVVADAAHLPFRDRAFDVVGSFDVIEHVHEPDAAVAEQARVCRDGGRVVTSVPAFPALWSSHDEAVGHLRRYTRASLRTTAERGALTECGSTYFFSWLSIPAWLARKADRRTAEPANGFGWKDRIVRRVIGSVCSLERWALRRWRLPFGTSLWSEFSRRSDDGSGRRG
jgi:SAM-dependent methyltransferase